MTTRRPPTKHRGAKNGVPGIRFVSGECECAGCKGWMWSRHLIVGTRLEPYHVYDRIRAGETVEDMMFGFELTREQVEAALEWGRRYGGLKDAG